MRTVNYTELRSNLKGYLNQVIADSEPLLVHRNGNENVVMISLDEYNSYKETQYIMRSEKLMDAIRHGDKEIYEGKGKAVDVDDLWK